MSSDDDRPAWWEKNDRLKRELGIPGYEPPQFSDGTYTHRVIDQLEETYDCTIRFAGFNTTYPEDWTVLVDGESIMGVGRFRDTNGNTVYEIDADAFRQEFERRMEHDRNDA